MCSCATVLIKERNDILIYVGIDVASKKHDYAIMNDLGEIVSTGTIENSLDGFKKLQDAIDNAQEFFQDQNIRIGLESTGHYSINILHHLAKNDYKVMLINPLLTNMDRKSSSLRKTKTDKIDALSICMFLDRNKFDFKPYTLKSYHTDELKSLSRERLAIKKQLRIELNKLHALISITFPEYYKVFKNIQLKVSYQVLKTYGIPSVIATTRIDGLTNTLLKGSRGHYGYEQAVTLKTLAQETIGQDSRVYAFQIKALVERIEFLNEQIKSFEAEIKAIIDTHFTYLLSVPGIGYTTAGIILGEIGNILRFSNANKLLAYAGLDPSVYQSGDYDAPKRKISKRGSASLRWAIHIVSSRIIHCDQTFNDYYHKKMSKEGKNYLTTLGHVTKKVTRVLYSIIKHQKEFIPQT